MGGVGRDRCQRCRSAPRPDLFFLDSEPCVGPGWGCRRRSRLAQEASADYTREFAAQSAPERRRSLAKGAVLPRLAGRSWTPTPPRRPAITSPHDRRARRRRRAPPPRPHAPRSPLREPAYAASGARRSPARSSASNSACGRCPCSVARRDAIVSFWIRPFAAGPQDVRDLPRVARPEARRAPRRADHVGEDAQALVPELRHLARRPPPAARRSPPGSRAPRRSGSTRGCASSARGRSGRGGGSGRRGSAGARRRLAHALLEERAVVREHGDVELALVLEVAVERALRDARALRDLVEVRGDEAVAEEDLSRGLEDVPAGAPSSSSRAIARSRARRPRPSRVSAQTSSLPS